MKPEAKTRARLLEELARLRPELARLEAAQSGPCHPEQAADLQRSLMESNVMWLEVRDTNADLVIWNEAAEEISGYARDEVIGQKTAWEMLYPDEEYRRGVVGRALAVIQGGEAIRDAETVITRKDGQTRTISWNVSPLRNVHGEPTGCIALGRDVTEQKRAEEAVRQTQDSYRMLVDNLSAGVLRIDMLSGTQSVHANAALVRMFGCESVEELAEWFASNAEAQDEHERAISEAARLKGLSGFEMSLHTKAGAPITVRLSAGVECGDTGRPERVVAVVEDVTERRQAEKALRESEEKYRTLVEDLNTGVFKFWKTANGMQGEANAALVRMLGCESLKELVAWNASEPQMLRQLDEFMETVRQQGTVRGLQYRVTTRDGKAIVTSVSAQAERDERGDLKRISGTVEDVTVRVQAEAALRESEERYRTLVEGLNTGVFRFFPVSRRLECNTALARMHGFRSADELLAWARTNPQMWEQGERVMEAVREKGYVTNLEVARQTVDGTSITIAISAKAEYDERGQIRSVAGTVEDVTERERAQQDLLSYQERLRSLALQLLSAEERERRRMAAVLHDELGQTLAMAAMKAGALKRSASARRLTAGLDEVVALIQQALQASRSLTTELSPPMLHELGLEPALQWLADQWRENHGLAVTVETDGASSPLREETAAVLFRSVRELLVNVVKHARASRAGVLIQGGDGEVRVTVEDDGVGFDASEGGLQGSRTGAFGLFSIREQLSHFGGRLEVKTERGHGTAVRLTVPLDPDGPAGKEDGE